MGLLAGFIAKEFADDASRNREIEKGDAAIFAIPAIRQPENSKNSGNSRGANLKTGHVCANCGEPAAFGVGWFIRQPEAGRWYCAGCVPVSGRG